MSRLSVLVTWQGASSRDDFVPQETFGSVCRQFCLPQPEQECYRVEAGDTARCPSVPGTVIHIKELFSQNVSGAKIEKPYPRATDPRKRNVEATMSFMT